MNAQRSPAVDAAPQPPAAAASRVDTVARLPRRARRRASTPQGAGGYRLAAAFLLPSLVFLGLFVFSPLAEAMKLSLYDWDGLAPSMEFVGLDNFTHLLTETRFLKSLLRNVIWWAMHVGLAAGGGLVLAALLAEVRWGQRTFRTLAFLPYVLSLAVVGVIWGQLYHPSIGLVNTVLDTLGLDWLTRPWLGDSTLALPATGLASGWQAYGFYMVIFLAAIQGIDPQLYEAAEVDGASHWQRFRHITVPSLHNTITLVATLAFINSLKGFGTIWAMTGGGPVHATELVAVYVWRMAFQVGDIGRAAAAGFLLGVFVIVCTVAFNSWRDRRAA